jgi:hypothetical protein
VPSASAGALSEFVVIALALVPLFLLMPMIGKYQDLAHATEMASRYVAFDAMANNANSVDGYKQSGQLAAEVRRRFFSNSDAPIKTGDEAGDFQANRNLMWVDPQGDPLIKKFSDVTVSFGAGHNPTPLDGMSGSADSEPFNVPTPWKVADTMELKNGIYTANVSVSLANVQELLGSYASSYSELSKLNLSITRSTAVLINPWTASDAGQINARLSHETLFPGLALAPIKDVVDAAVNVIEIPACFPAVCSGKGPQLGQLSYWDDLVPPDRTQ